MQKWLEGRVIEEKEKRSFKRMKEGRWKGKKEFKSKENDNEQRKRLNEKEKQNGRKDKKNRKSEEIKKRNEYIMKEKYL